MKRPLLLLLLLFSAGCLALYHFNDFWVHRFDPLIERQAKIYGLDPDLVWSIIYEETYFRPWRVGADGEIGLMQVTPAVGREWAARTGMRDLEREMTRDPYTALSDPERNIQIGCWYLEEVSKEYRDVPGADARMIAAYNAGPSRAADWSQTSDGHPLSASAFIARIDIPSTRAYVTSILARYERLRRARPAAGATPDRGVPR